MVGFWKSAQHYVVCVFVASAFLVSVSSFGLPKSDVRGRSCRMNGAGALNMATRTDLRNVAIIAHVDHGKTTLVDTLLRFGGIHFKDECAMDSNEL